MSPVLLAGAATLLLVVMYAGHRWSMLADHERIRSRVGTAPPPLTRFGRTDRLLGGLPGLASLAQRVRAAGIPLGLTDVLLLHVPLALVAARVGERLWGPTLGPPLALVGLAMTTWFGLGGVAARRRERIVAQVPDLIRLLAAGARAGLSMTRALAEAADDLGEPTAGELRRVVVAVELGKPLPEALEEFARRLGSAELDIVTSAVAIQQRSGGDLVKLLGRLGLGIEAMHRGRREVRAVTAGLSSQAYIGLVMGLGGAALMQRVTGGGLERAMHSPLPATVVLFCVLLLVAAAPVMNRLTRVVR